MNGADLLRMNESLLNQELETFQRSELGRLLNGMRERNKVFVFNMPRCFDIQKPSSRGFLILEDYIASKIQKEIQAESSEDLSNMLARQKQKERKQ